MESYFETNHTYLHCVMCICANNVEQNDVVYYVCPHRQIIWAKMYVTWTAGFYIIAKY